MIRPFDSGASIDSTPTAGIQIQDNTMTVNVRADQLPVAPSALDAAAGFTIQPDSACTSGLAIGRSHSRATRERRTT